MFSVRWRLGVIAAAAAFAVLFAAGCGGGGGSDSESGSAGASTGKSESGALKKSPIVIGMISPLTGPYDGESDAANADVAKAWEEWVNNEEGGINGHPVEVLVRDSKNDTVTALRLTKELIADPHVLAQVGGMDPIAESVVVKAFSDAKVPVIGGETTNPETMEKSPYLFPLVPAVTDGVPMFADGAKASGIKSLGMVLCSQAATCNGAAELLQPRVEELGMTFAGSIGVSDGEPDYSAACLSLEGKGAELIQLAVTLQTAIKVIEDCERQGSDFRFYATQYGSFDGSTLRPLSESTKPIVGNINGFPWWEDAPAIDQYREVIEKYAPEADYENDVQSEAWAALEMFRKAMADAGANPTRAEVAEAMWQVKNEDLEGLLPNPVTFKKGQTGSPVNCQWRTTLESGEFTDTKVVCLDEKGGA